LIVEVGKKEKDNAETLRAQRVRKEEKKAVRHGGAGLTWIRVVLKIGGF
jgi:hypothetical protein